MKKFVNNFLEFSYNSPVAFFVVKNSIELLEKNGFNKLNIEDKWILNNNQKYYVSFKDIMFKHSYYELYKDYGNLKLLKSLTKKV